MVAFGDGTLSGCTVSGKTLGSVWNVPLGEPGGVYHLFSWTTCRDILILRLESQSRPSPYQLNMQWTTLPWKAPSLQALPEHLCGHNRTRL